MKVVRTKICDQVSEDVLDACLTLDSRCRVACETCLKENMVMVAEITKSVLECNVMMVECDPRRGKCIVCLQ